MKIEQFHDQELEELNTLLGSELPREANLDRLFSFIDGKRSDESFDSNDLGMSETAFLHLIHLARFFGLVDDSPDYNLTNRGNAVASLTNAGRIARLATTLESNLTIRKWMHFLGVESVEEIPASSSSRFVQAQCSDLRTTTKKGRSSVLKRILVQLQPHLPSNPKNIDLSLERNPAYSGMDIVPRFDKQIGNLVEEFKTSFGTTRVSTGWMSAAGYDIVARNQRDSAMKILLGADDSRGKALLESPLAQFKHAMESGLPSPRKFAEHKRMYEELVSGTRRIRQVTPKILDKLHGKGYFFGLNSAVVTSANMTANGLIWNAETASATTIEEQVRYLVQRFEAYFEMGEDVLTEFIELIEESWVFQEPVSGYLAYLRVLQDFYDEGLVRPDDEIELAEFQRMIVSSAIHSLRNGDGALVISPTGTGKTVMGSYIARYFSENDQSLRPVVIAPNKPIATKWVEYLQAFGVVPLVINHQEIRIMNEKTRRKISRVIDGRSFLIVDEAHRFRTESNDGTQNFDDLVSGKLTPRESRKRCY